jgi:hypothetical protein
MNLDKSIGLIIVFSTLFLAVFPQGKSIAASPECKLEDGKHYQMNGRFGGDSRENDIVLSFDGTVEGSGTKVDLFSGIWRLADNTSADNEISVQASASTFIMLRQADAGLKQIWAGTCQSDNFIIGDIWDPTIGKGEFSMRLGPSQGILPNPEWFTDSVIRNDGFSLAGDKKDLCLVKNNGRIELGCNNAPAFEQLEKLNECALCLTGNFSRSYKQFSSAIFWY